LLDNNNSLNSLFTFSKLQNKRNCLVELSLVHGGLPKHYRLTGIKTNSSNKMGCTLDFKTTMNCLEKQRAAYFTKYLLNIKPRHRIQNSSGTQCTYMTLYGMPFGFFYISL
jgi:hypothetical protein